MPRKKKRKKKEGKYDKMNQSLLHSHQKEKRNYFAKHTQKGNKNSNPDR